MKCSKGFENEILQCFQFDMFQLRQLRKQKQKEIALGLCQLEILIQHRDHK